MPGDDQRTEIHFHLLPGVDDGPTTMEEALSLAREACRDGTAEVVATPHASRADVPALPGAVAELQARLREAGVPLRVQGGGEVHPDDVVTLSEEDLDILAVGPPEARWVLLEAPLFGPGDALEPAAVELGERGYGVVIAHPERSFGLYELGAEEILRRETERGTRVQVNATSLTGYHGDEPRERALELVAAGLVHAVASDAHRLERGPALTTARRQLAVAFGDEVARQLVDIGPAELLAGGVRATALHR